MNCKQFQSELERAIDDRQLSDRSAVSSHADSCESCRSAWQDFLLLESALASWTEPVEIDLVERVIAAAIKPVPSPPSRGEGGRRPDEGVPRTSVGKPGSVSTSPSPALRAPSPPRGEGARQTWLTIATVAVVVLGAAFAFRPGLNQTADDDSPLQTPGHIPLEPELNEVDQYAGVDELLASTRSAWDGIASKAVNQASDLSVFMPDLKADLGLPESDSTTIPDEPSPEVSPEKESREKESLIPGRINRAFDFLLDVSEVTTT